MTARPAFVPSVLLCGILVLACIAGAGCTAVSDTASAVPEANVSEDPVVSPVTEPAGTVMAVSAGTTVQPMVTQGGYVRLTVTAPYGDHYVSVSSGGIIPEGQPGVEVLTPTYAKIHVDTSGKLSFAVRSVNTDDITVRLVD
ncbi:MAG TPA: hypothetical protein O0X27_03020 [Methanocorpusculum sp.]|nr:hypothetical protein [Methanocorpusculum sp.]